MLGIIGEIAGKTELVSQFVSQCKGIDLVEPIIIEILRSDGSGLTVLIIGSS